MSRNDIIRHYDLYTYLAIYEDVRFKDDTIYKVFSFRAATPATAEEVAMVHSLDFQGIIDGYRVVNLILQSVNHERKSEPMFI